jgi:hypothetical protein
MPANTTTDAAAFSNKSYDILIVGGGTAGLALAARYVSALTCEIVTPERASPASLRILISLLALLRLVQTSVEILWLLLLVSVIQGFHPLFASR